MKRPAPDRLDPAIVRLAGIVVVGALASLLDTTILSVAINGFARRFDVPLATVQWVATSYLLAMAVAIPLTGWSVERFGTKTMWMSALTVFVAASALCGAAWSIESLIVFRALQGLAGGMILPLAQTIVAQAAGPARFGRAMALLAIPGQLAPVVGPIIGGVLIDGVGWRWVFYINVPVVGLALLLAWRSMPTDHRADRPALDLVGLALLSPGLAALIYALSRVGAAPAGAAATVIAALGLCLVAAFYRHALRAGGRALLDLRLFKIRSYALLSILTFLSGASIFGAMFLLPLYYQRVHGLSAMQAGIMLSPQGLGTALSVLVAGRLHDRVGTRPVVLAGLAVTVLATIPFALAGTGDAVRLGTLLIRGMGLGAAGIAIMAGAYQRLRHDQIPRATALTSVVQRLGGTFGTTVLAVILQSAGGGAATPGVREAAFRETFWWTVAFALVGLVPVWLLPAGADEQRAKNVRGATDDRPRSAGHTRSAVQTTLGRADSFSGRAKPLPDDNDSAGSLT